jgi:hypothetical protein
MFTQITGTFSALVTPHSNIFAEYGPELHYVEGPRNVIADTFSRLSCNAVTSEDAKMYLLTIDYLDGCGYCISVKK